MSRNYSCIDNFLNDAEKIVIPEEYVIAAWIIYKNGDDEYVSAEEAMEIYNQGSMDEQGIESIRTIVDMELIKDVVIQVSDEILDSIY